MTPADVLKLIKEKEAKFVDLRFTDTIGKEQHVTVPTRLVDEGFFKDGKMFDVAPPSVDGRESMSPT